MHEILNQHKDILFSWPLWLPMLGLWVQAAMSARGIARRKRDDARRAAGDKRMRRPVRPAGPPRLIAPR